MSSSYVLVMARSRVHPAGIYMFKVNNRNTRTRCEICSELTINANWVLRLFSSLLHLFLPACYR